MIKWPNKDPSDIIDHGIDWTEHLPADDTIATVAWSVEPAGLTPGAQALVGNVASVWLSGGTAGTTYRVTCRVTTTGGRQMDRSALIFVTER